VEDVDRTLPDAFDEFQGLSKNAEGKPCRGLDVFHGFVEPIVYVEVDGFGGAEWSCPQASISSLLFSSPPPPTPGDSTEFGGAIVSAVKSFATSWTAENAAEAFEDSFPHTDAAPELKNPPLALRGELADLNAALCPSDDDGDGVRGGTCDPCVFSVYDEYMDPESKGLKLSWRVR